MNFIVLFFTFLTGFSGLVFQVVWQKYFSYFLGGEALASTLVVTIFLSGISIGFTFFGRLARGKSIARLLVIAGLAEIGIGVWVILFPTLFDLIWNNLDAFPHMQPWRSICDFLVTTLLLFPSTILMGSTLPLLTPALAREKKDLSSAHAAIYGINALGAFAGAIFAGFVLIPSFGLPITLILLSMVNLLAGTVYYLISKDKNLLQRVEKSSVEIDKVKVPLLAMALALLSGLVCIGVEIIAIRSMSLAIGSSDYSYGLVVGVFILMIALGTLSLQWKRNIWTHQIFVNQAIVTISLSLVYLTIPYWGWLSYVARISLLPIPSNFAVYHFAVFCLFSFFISVPAFFMGRTMPLLFNALNSRITNASESVGSIYAINTIGCCIGGVLMGYILFLKFNADIVLRFGIALSGVATIVAIFFKNGILSKRRLQFYASLGIVIIFCLIIFSLPNWEPKLLSAGFFRIREYSDLIFHRPKWFANHPDRGQIIFFRDDPNTNVTITKQIDDQLSLIVNGKSDGNSKGPDLLTTLLLGHLPGLFTQVKGDAAIIGLGLGTTGRAISQYSNIPHVDIFEIADAVIQAQPIFNSVNDDILHNPKVSIYHADAFRGLLATQKKYAAVISEPSNPWVSGVDRLYSTEFYKIAQKKLLPGGVFAQWIHTYELSKQTLGIVMRTFSQVFPHIRIFSTNSDLIIIGSENPWSDQNWNDAQQRWNYQEIGKELTQFQIRDFTDLALYEVFYPTEIIERFGEHTLLFPKLSYAAAKNFFTAANFSLSNLNIVDPTFSFAKRMREKNSLLTWALTHNANFGNQINKVCREDQQNLKNIKLQNMTPACRASVVFLATLGILNPTQTDMDLMNEVSWLKEISSNSSNMILLPLVQLFRLLSNYPSGIPAPSLDFFSKLTKLCEQEKDSFNCYSAIIRLQIKFGHFKSAEEIFAAKLVVNSGRPIADFDLLEQMENLHYLMQRQ